MLTQELKLTILFGTLLVVLTVNQIIKAMGKTNRTGSLLDQLISSGPADICAFCVAIFVVVYTSWRGVRPAWPPRWRG